MDYGARDSLSEVNLIQAMEQGDFYATTGVTLTQLQYDRNELTVAVAAEEGIRYKIEFVGADLAGQSKVFESVENNEARFEITQDMLFVRARITSTRPKENPFGEATSRWHGLSRFNLFQNEPTGIIRDRIPTNVVKRPHKVGIAPRRGDGPPVYLCNGVGGKILSGETHEQSRSRC
ncbi:MAG: hypothetical protein HC859_15960, partial [Bacteroidia bacterium]|nr:hypothetical protein [Bacteroidia bacterium]